MINIFIDTNVYLDFYHLSNDDIEELNKLLVAIQERQIRLFVTDQVKDEYRRNRETKIAAALKTLDEVKLGISFPRLIQGYDEYKLMQTEVRNFGEHLSALRNRLSSDIESKNLGPDTLIEQLMSLATFIAEDDEVLVAAQRRSLLRRPPGKKDSLGDAINWEAMLRETPVGEDLNLISIDGDFVTPLVKDKLNSYLADEWRECKSSEITLYKSLGDFFKDKYPGIKLAYDLKRSMAVQGLASSSNFMRTHRYITKLRSLGELSDEEARDVFDAALTNNQIYWLGQDSDVNKYIRSLLDTKADLLEPTEVQKLNERYPAFEPIPEAGVSLDELPF